MRVALHWLIFFMIELLLIQKKNVLLHFQIQEY